MDKRILEIDVLKGVGICMVLINHSYDYVYTSALLFKLSRSCVQLLLFCAGVNMFLKIRKLLAGRTVRPAPQAVGKPPACGDHRCCASWSLM